MCVLIRGVIDKFVAWGRRRWDARLSLDARAVQYLVWLCRMFWLLWHFCFRSLKIASQHCLIKWKTSALAQPSATSAKGVQEDMVATLGEVAPSYGMVKKWAPWLINLWYQGSDWLHMKADVHFPRQCWLVIFNDLKQKFHKSYWLQMTCITHLLLHYTTNLSITPRICVYLQFSVKKILIFIFTA